MRTKQIVRCPNCGELAQREFFQKLLSDCINLSQKTVTKTECKCCDYLMVMNRDDGQVLETYALGISLKTMLKISTC